MLSVLASSNRLFPWLWLALGIAVAQIVCNSRSLVAVAVVSLVLLLLPKWRTLHLVLLGGAVGVIILPTKMQQVSEGQLTNGQSYVLSVSGSIRHFRAGGVWFDGEVVAVLSERAELKKLPQPIAVSCVTAELPWRNGADIHKGDIRVIGGTFRRVSAAEKQLGKRADFMCKARLVSQPLKRELSDFETGKIALLRKLQQILGEHERFGLVVSLSLGERDRLTRETDEVLRQLGVAHFFVVSGYHVAIVFGVLLWFSRWLRVIGIRFLVKGFSPIFEILLPYGGAFLYVRLTGCEPSAVRALVALTCFCFFSVRGMRVPYWTAFVLSFVVVSSFWPRAVLNPGVQLTFAALFGIGLALRSSSKPSLLLIGFSATSATSFVSLFWFDRFSYVAFLLQPVAGLIFGPVLLPFTLLGELFVFLGCSVGEVFVETSASLLQVVISGLRWVAATPFASVEVTTWWGKVSLGVLLLFVLVSVNSPNFFRAKWFAILNRYRILVVSA